MIQIKEKDNDDDLFPISDASNIKSHDVAYTIVEFKPKYRAYMDLIGSFP